MEPIRRWHEDEMEKRQKNNELLLGLEKMTEAITNGISSSHKEMCNVFKDRPNKLEKPAKVPSWSKGMELDVYVKSLQVWMEMNKDVSEADRYQDVIESLKVNKKIEGLAKYVGEHVITRLDTIEKQKVKEIVDLLKLKYGRTRIEELEELMEDWIKFNFNEYESEEDYLFAMEKMIARKEEKQVTMREWDAIWMMIGARKRKGIENYQLLELRKVLKANGEKLRKILEKSIES